jgi:hypothetical protein
MLLTRDHPLENLRDGGHTEALLNQKKLGLSLMNGSCVSFVTCCIARFVPAHGDRLVTAATLWQHLASLPQSPAHTSTCLWPSFATMPQQSW